MSKQSLINGTVIILSVVIIAVSGVCIYNRLPVDSTYNENNVKLAVAGFAMPSGTVRGNSSQKITKPQYTEIQPETEAATDAAVQTFDSAGITVRKRTDDADHTDDPQYPVIESQYGESGEGYSNFYVKNTTDFTIDYEKYLNSPLPFTMENKKDPQVLIFHTHSCESYLDNDEGFYYDSYYPRDSDDNFNMVKVGSAIVSTLNANGVTAIHATEHHDEPSYNGSYDRSRETIDKYLKKYPSIKVVIDVHRDSIGYGGEQGKIKPTFVYNNKKAAQIMIMSGYDGDGALGFPNWEENLVFALQLQQKAESMYPGMTRPLSFGNFCYNMDVNSGSILIEVGTDVNTVEEAVYSGELLGNVLSKLLG